MYSGTDTKYLECKWTQLPEEVQEAAKDLGFTPDNWDKQSNDIYKRKWKKLTNKQKEAAEVLGWDEDSWKIKYDDCDWDELPETVQQAATFLGYNQKMWDDDKHPSDLDEYDWDDLSDDQRKACFVLGITGEEDWEES